MLGLEMSEGQREMGWREKDWIHRDRERESAQAERQKDKLREKGSWPGAGVWPACSCTSQRGELLTPGRSSFSQSENTDQVTHSGPGLGWAEQAVRLVPVPGREQSRQRETWKPLGSTLQIPILELLVLMTNQNKMLAIQIMMKLPFFPQFCEFWPPLLSQHTAPSQQPSKHRLASG